MLAIVGVSICCGEQKQLREIKDFVICKIDASMILISTTTSSFTSVFRLVPLAHLKAWLRVNFKILPIENTTVRMKIIPVEKNYLLSQKNTQFESSYSVPFILFVMTWKVQ